MEEDEMKMSKAELEQWIRLKVKKSRLLDPEVLEKRFELQSLLEMKQKMADNLLKLQESVASCEAIVRKQYSLLGLEYRDTDSDEDKNSCGDSAVTGRTHLSPKQLGSKNPQGSRKPFQMMEPVVVLTRLPDLQMLDLRPPTTPMSNSDDHSLSDADSDELWEPEKESSDSQDPSYNSGPKKRRKIDHVSPKKHETKHESEQADTKTEADSTEAKTLEPQAKEQKNTEHEQEEKNTTKESSPPVNTKVTGVTAPCTSSGDATKAPPSAPQVELSVNMKVLARKNPMIWQPGKIAEILTKEDGRLKYKVIFVEKGKSLVSAHHIASEQVSSIEQVFVGARVVVKSKVDRNYFPGVLAELPSRKNKMRFLIFIDDHTPIYVPLHGFRLVCQPLSCPLDDIQDDAHKKFMAGYLKSWPNTLMTHYPQGETIEAEHKGVQKKCEVLTVDSSLVQVVFKEDQHKQWFYRGSMRLKHMINLRKQMELEKVKK
ncbi:histone-lysine N-methyltransferase SETDB1-B-like isoform X2 [Limanda limanda]|uniref:histone-lysine N-methyltransferase SETDB1-B-like isoform X2 n=1 Tax=Limanda limanda TaxID=27771 RepID=UPI0029C60386|nr:histone-lysine N-methyltransferase SETDB1-B-like isoform X2 [Limanda limanda]